MATLHDILHGQHEGDGVSFAPVTPREKHQALALLLTGSPRVDASVDAFLNMTDEQELSTDMLWSAKRAGRPIAAVLVIPCPGRTAMMFTSPLERAGEASVVAELVRFACRSQEPAKVQLIQSLLEPGQSAQRQALESAGFARLAELIYMTRPAPAERTPLTLDAGLEVVHYGPGRRELFGRAILASYEGTRDCPGLLGVRDIDDILDGHMAAGKFRAELWFTLMADGQPAAVMLLNPIPQRQAIELVYLGVSPNWRGRGIAKALLTHGLGLARQHHANEIILAVDRDNAPAVRLYQSLQFAPSARKVAMMFTLQ
jgi:mycothiol synthase